MTTEQAEQRVQMLGGPATAAVPAVVLIATLTWMSVEGRATITGFWVGGFAAIVVGLLLTTNRRAYADSVVRGLSDKTGAVIIAAWIFAGVFGALLEGAGLVDGLLWLGLETGLSGAAFTVLAFLLACLFAVGTGTSVGTILAMVPVLYPAGVFLGSDPTMVAVAVIAGGAFGDNLAPISDTTIASAYTAKAVMADVVRSRLPLSLSAAGVAVVVFAVFGGGGGESSTHSAVAEPSATGLLMILPFALVMALALMRRHIIESLTWGSLATIALGFVSGQLHPGEVFSIPQTSGDSTGLIEDGIAGVSGAVILVLFVLALAQVFADSGLVARLLAQLEAHAARGVRSAELAIAGITLLFTVPLGSNAPAILLVGPTVGRPLGRRYGLAPARIANLMDCSANTAYYMMPWHNAVIVWYAAVQTAARTHDLPAPSIAAAALNPYSWALLVVLVVSIVTGWNRKYAPETELA
ncbi:MAG: Na+/H+ antiporter NhaC family protein [Pseudonocardiaceae bacterium]